MEINELQKRLLAAARSLPPREQVPYAFERRIMASIAAHPGPDPWAVWSQLLWRGAIPCVTVMLGMSIWALAFGDLSGSPETLASVFERAVSAPISSLEVVW